VSGPSFEAVGEVDPRPALHAPGSAVVKRDLAALFIRLANQSAGSGKLFGCDAT